MSIDILISTMNLNSIKEYDSLIKKMNIKGNSIVINQCPNNDIILENIDKDNNKLFSYREKGLSKSRNIAIDKSDADICVIADDDLEYVDDYKKIINDAYGEFPDADMIAFYVSSDNPNNKKTKLKKGKVDVLRTFKIQSVQISFKRKRIIEKNIRFDESFGAGTNKYMGEENIFIFDCIKSGLKLYSYPVELAKLDNSESTWFKGYNKKYFEVKGACFYRMSRVFWFLLCLQFAIRKRKLYKKETSFLNAVRYMCSGKKQYINNK